MGGDPGSVWRAGVDHRNDHSRLLVRLVTMDHYGHDNTPTGVLRPHLAAAPFLSPKLPPF
jgi:hypothetical protein